VLENLIRLSDLVVSNLGRVRICQDSKTKDKPFGSYCKHRRASKLCKGCDFYVSRADRLLRKRTYL
jgi:hypothetical protein